MTSVYPGALDSLNTALVNATNEFNTHPNHHNDLADAINKIEAELGISPKGAFGTVKARLDSIAVSKTRINIADAPYSVSPHPTTDWTTQINQAITDANAAAVGPIEIYFPKGLYRFTTLTMKSNVTLIGDGMTQTIFRTLGPASVNALISSTGTRMRLQDLTIDGNNHANAARGLSVTGNGNDKFLEVRRVKFMKFTTNTPMSPGSAAGIYVWTCQQVKIIECEFEDCVNPIFADTAEATTWIVNNTITNPGLLCADGITIKDGSGAIVMGNKIYDVTIDAGAIGVDGHAIQNISCAGAQIIGNYVKNCKTAGIHVGGAAGGCSIVGNTLINCCTLNGGAIYLEILFGSTNLPTATDIFGGMIMGNRIYNAGVFGISLSYSAGTLCKGNHIAKCQQEAIITDSDRCIIEGNECVNSHRSGTNLITASPNVKSHIRCYGPSTRCAISNNMCYDSASPKVCDYGVAVTDASHTIVGNQLGGNLTGGLFEVGATTNQKAANIVT